VILDDLTSRCRFSPPFLLYPRLCQRLRMSACEPFSPASYFFFFDFASCFSRLAKSYSIFELVLLPVPLDWPCGWLFLPCRAVSFLLGHEMRARLLPMRLSQYRPIFCSVTFCLVPSCVYRPFYVKLITPPHRRVRLALLPLLLKRPHFGSPPPSPPAET